MPYYRAIGIGVRIDNVGKPNILVTLPPLPQNIFYENGVSLIKFVCTLSLEPKTQPFISEMSKISMIYLFTSGGGLFSALGIE